VYSTVTESIQAKMFASTWTIPFRAVTASVLAVAIIAPLTAQEIPASAKDKAADAVKVGYYIDVPVPLNSGDANQLIGRLTRLNELAPEGKRVTVVLRYKSGDAESGAETQFEDALKVARAMTGPPLRRVRIVSLVEREIVGHSNLPIVASEMILVSTTEAWRTHRPPIQLPMKRSDCSTARLPASEVFFHQQSYRHWSILDWNWR
jgi:hypothetical protein